MLRVVNHAIVTGAAIGGIEHGLQVERVVVVPGFERDWDHRQPLREPDWPDPALGPEWHWRDMDEVFVGSDPFA